MQAEDLKFIASNLHMGVPPMLLDKMVSFLAALQSAASQRPTSGRGPFAAAGGPWEFNLRDLLRWCDLLGRTPLPTTDDQARDAAMVDAAEHYVHMLFAQRLRNDEDRERLCAIWESVWGAPLCRPAIANAVTADLISLDVTSQSVRIGRAMLSRGEPVARLPCWHCLPNLESYRGVRRSFLPEYVAADICCNFRSLAPGHHVPCKC